MPRANRSRPAVSASRPSGKVPRSAVPGHPAVAGGPRCRQPIGATPPARQNQLPGRCRPYAADHFARHASRVPRRHAVRHRNPAHGRGSPDAQRQSRQPSGHTETHGQRTAPRPTSAIAASGQLPEDWPSNGQVHRRLAPAAGESRTRRPFRTASQLCQPGMGEAGQVRDAHRGERTWISSVALAAAGSAPAPAGSRTAAWRR
jgi:hypothetical protein